MSNQPHQPSSFWARRRAGLEAEARAEAELAARAEQAKLEERSDEDLLAEAKLPDPDTLETPEAVQDFLRAELPQRLKMRALRRLWRMNPILANLDGLVDYGEDYTDAATVLEHLPTVYQVGKGMLTAWIEDEKEEEAVEVEAEEAPAEPEAAPVEPEPIVIAEAPTPEPDPIETAMPQRRMRFAFDDA